MAYFRSNQYTVKKKLIEKNTAAIELMKKGPKMESRPKPEQRTFNVYTKNLEIDKTEVKTAEKEKQYFLASALT